MDLSLGGIRAGKGGLWRRRRVAGGAGVAARGRNERTCPDRAPSLAGLVSVSEVEVASQKPLIIDLDHARSATALPVAQQLYREQFDGVMALVRDFADRAERGTERRGSGRGADPSDVLHESILVAGARGSGKTTFILSLGRALAAEEGARVAALHPLDPTMVDGDTVFIAAVVANILRHVEDHLRSNRGAKAEALQKSLERLSDGMMASSEKAWERALLQAGSSAAFAERLLTFARGGLRLREVFADFVDAAANLCGAAIFVQPIDDVDTAGPQAQTVLDTVRRYLTNPRILPVITGDAVQFRQVLLAARLDELKVLWAHDRAEASHRVNAVRGAEALADQYLLKLIRPERRFQLRSAREALKDRKVTVRDGGREVSIEELLGDAVDWTSPWPGYANHMALVPENTRLLRALIVWAVEPSRRDATQEWKSEDFVELLKVDDQAQRLTDWSASALRELAAGRFASFRAWTLTEGAPRARLALQPAEPPEGDEWSEAIVRRAAAGALRAAFLQDHLLPLRYFSEVAWPVVVAQAYGLGRAVEGLVERGEGRGTAARILSVRWDVSTASPAVQPGMARLPNATARTKQTDALRWRWWQLRGTPGQLGPLPWLRWLWGGDGGTDRREHVRKLLALARRGRGRAVQLPDATWLFEPEIDRMLAVEGRPGQRALFRFVMSWFRGHVGVSTGESQVLDLGMGLAAVVDLAVRYRALSVSERSEDGVRRLLEEVVAGSNEPSPASKPPATATSAGDDEEEDADLLDSGQDEAWGPALPDAFISDVKTWLDGVVGAPTTGNPVRPGVLARWAAGWLATQRSQADPKTAQAWCVGSFLTRGVLGMLNALLVAEARGEGRVVREERSMVATLRFDPPSPTGVLPGKYAPSGYLLDNLGAVRRHTLRGDTGLPIFGLMADCPILGLVLLPDWRDALSGASVFPTYEYARVQLGGTNDGEIDLAVLLHALPLMPAALRSGTARYAVAKGDEYWAERLGVPATAKDEVSPTVDRGVSNESLPASGQWETLTRISDEDPLLVRFMDSEPRKKFIAGLRMLKNFNNPTYFAGVRNRANYLRLYEEVLLPHWRASQVDAATSLSPT